MGMTVDSLAQSYYNQYNFLNSQTNQKNTVDPSSVSENDYGVSNLSNALNVLNDTESANPISTNLDKFVENSYELSQLPEYNTLNGMISDSGNPLNIAGSVDNSISANYMQNILGLNSDTFNINSVSTPTATSQMELTSAAITQNYDSSTDDSYQNFLNQNLVGGNLNISA
jgi:hypothetical protein